MILRGIIAAILTCIIGTVLSAIIMPLILPADALEKSAAAAGPTWCLIGILVGIVIAIKHKKRMNKTRVASDVNKPSDDKENAQA